MNGAKGCTQTNNRTAMDQSLLECISRVADKFDVMADAVVNSQNLNINSLVRQGVQGALAPTISALNDIKELLNK